MQKHQEAIKTLSALASDPKTATDEVLYDLAWSQQSAKDAKNAEQTYRVLLRNFPQSKLVAAARSELGEILFQQDKFAEAAELLQINPQFSLEVHKQREPIKDPALLERHIAALRKAGLQ